jgi:hypothetical protein
MLEEAPVDLSQPVPLTALAKVRAPTRGWLQSAPMVQVDDPKVQALAAQIRERSGTVQELVRNTLGAITALRRNWTGNEGVVQNDAVSFLTSGLGECVAHSNLFAALMRANGVPTRIVTGVSRGCGHGINMHYQNEYFAPGKGWVHVEPQGRDIQSSRVAMVHTGVVPPAMEKRGFGLEEYGGVPMLTMKPQVVDGRGQAVVGDRAGLTLSGGLVVENSRLGGVALHGA